MNFLHSIKAGEPTHEAHKNLLRFGKGEFTREQITIRKTKKHIDVAAGFEYYITLYRIFLDVVDCSDIQVKGVIIGPKQQMQQVLEEMNIQPAKVFGKKFTLDYVADKRELIRLADRMDETTGHLLLTLKCDDGTLTAKTTFPKPGKLIEKFCRLKIPLKHADRVTEELMIPDFEKKAVVETVYRIDQINFDDGLLETDPARARLESTRNVELVRTITLDTNEPIVETYNAVV